ncbi:MAG TPA: SDR family NAD(P)-dependent oxidoreductase, partial [Chitinophaga sp.]
MDLQLQQKVIIVSGGAKGIGNGIVNILAEEGAIPVIIGRDTQDNEAALAPILSRGAQGLAITAELLDPAACEQAIRTVRDTYGRIDGLVNNAGLNDGVSLEHGSYEGFMTSLHRNVV